MTNPKPTHFRRPQDTEWLDWRTYDFFEAKYKIRFDNGQVFNTMTGEWSVYVDSQEAVREEVAREIGYNIWGSEGPWTKRRILDVLSNYDIKKREGV